MTRRAVTIAVERLRELFDLDRETGVLRWRVNRGRVRAGSVAGTPSHGYLQVVVDGEWVGVHRVVWALTRGCWPRPHEVDHASRVGCDNRPSNLRRATQTQQNANSSVKSNNTSGFKGVCRGRSGRRWRALIRVNGKAIHLGTFDAKEDAAAAYLKAAAEHFGEYATAGV
jgi:hypothetical protein